MNARWNTIVTARSIGATRIHKRAPVANAGPDKIIVPRHDGDPARDIFRIKLDGSGCHDPDGDLISYQWTIRDGNRVLDLGTLATFEPFAPPTIGTYPYTLTVTDHYGASASDTVNVIGSPEPNQPPKLVGPASAWGNIGSPLRFTALAVDPDGDPLTFKSVMVP
jgi:hypothetical protein